jgi:predicted transcriptional regulator
MLRNPAGVIERARQAIGTGGAPATLKELARRIGVSQAVLCRVRSGKLPATPRTLERLRAILLPDAPA